ncbi:MAG: hypothetical protein F4092_13475 [Rhodospirillaceae bacterium]|nr:hypothetical protein [Rhodospirillaceae bacterium]
MFRLISSIGVVMATYAGFALLGPVLGPADFRMAAFLVEPAWAIPLPSGGMWPVDFRVLFLLVGLMALAFETLKTARAGGRTLGYRLLAILWLAGGGALFLLVGGFGTSTFLLLTAMAGFDAASGLLAPLLSSRPDADVPDEDSEAPRLEAPHAETPAAEDLPAHEPAPTVDR